MASNINPTLEPTKSLDAFRFWCQKVLPLVYDDSLSYYEVLGKMVVQLNDVIDNINADTANVLTLKDAFDELQEYVDNFFDDVEHLADYAERAEAAQTAANSSAINAASSAVNASISSQAAMDARAAAQTAAQDATASKNDAVTAATTATTKAGEAAQSAINAQTAQASASQNATLADAARSAAQGFANSATQSANIASDSAEAAETSEHNIENLIENLPSDFIEILNDVDDIKTSLKEFTGNEEIIFTPDSMIYSNTSPVDYANPRESTTGFSCAVVNCSEGDQFTISGTGGASPRLWCFIDDSGTVITVSGSNRTESGTVLTAPIGATKLVLNNNDNTAKSYIGALISVEIDRTKNALLNYVETDNVNNGKVGLPIPTGDIPNLLDGLVINTYPNLIHINGTNNLTGLRVCIANTLDSYTANPTITNKPKWFKDITAFKLNHSYAYSIKLISGSFQLNEGQADPTIVFRNNNTTLTVGNSGSFKCNEIINAVFYMCRTGTYNDAWFYFDIIDLTEDRTATDNQLTTKYKRIFDHLFINDTGNNITIPAESLFHVRVSSKLGFDVIEVHPQITSDDHYICNHLENGAFGNYFHHIDNTTNISATKVNTVTLTWIKENVRYNSSISKFQTAPPTLEEFLKECKQQGLTPMIYIGSDSNIASIANSILGENNYIAYGATRAICPKAAIMHWKNDLTDKNDILEYCKTIGKPFIYGISNFSSFNKTELNELAELLHDNGFWILTSYADNGTWANIYDGVDFYAATRSVNRVENGNICNFNTITDFDDFTLTNATVQNGIATFSADGTIQPDIDNTVYDISMIDIELWFNGTITLSAIGEQLTTLAKTSDGTTPIIFTVPIINGSPKFTLTASANTVVNNISFKASTC